MIVLIFLIAILIFLALCKLNNDWPGLIVISKAERYLPKRRESFSKAEVAYSVQEFVPQRKAPALLKPGGWELGRGNGSGPPWYSYTEGGQDKTAIEGSTMYEVISKSMGRR